MSSYIANVTKRRLHISPSLEICNCDNLKKRRNVDAIEAKRLYDSGYKLCKWCIKDFEVEHPAV